MPGTMPTWRMPPERKSHITHNFSATTRLHASSPHSLYATSNFVSVPAVIPSSECSSVRECLLPCLSSDSYRKPNSLSSLSSGHVICKYGNEVLAPFCELHFGQSVLTVHPEQIRYRTLSSPMIRSSKPINPLSPVSPSLQLVATWSELSPIAQSCRPLRTSTDFPASTRALPLRSDNR